MLSPDRDIRRLPSGFVTRGRYGWPRFWSQGVKLDTIVDLFDRLAKTGPLTATIGLEEGCFGHPMQYRDRDAPNLPIERIVAAGLATRLDAAGLMIDYRLTVAIKGKQPRPEPVRDSVTIGWEVPILRFTRIAKWH